MVKLRMSKLIKLHDHLARKFLSNITIAKEFLAIHLAPENICILAINLFLF